MTVVERDWWRGAVIYQVYPRSFRDGNGDGVGDLAGLAEGLDHIASLGVDAVWIAPFYTSPMKDFGYDVADYCDVDPIFGSLADFDRVLDAAHRRGLKVLIDQVWSHSSDRHPWFLDSAADRHGARADWYVWADPRPDGSPPNNWLSVFGGPAWRWDPRRRQYYLHHFLASQPALNLRHPAVLDALLAAGAFWLRRGVDGFRLDAVDFLCHDPLLRDNPPRPPPDGVMPLKPFALQEHIHDLAHVDSVAVLERIRALMDGYPGTTTVAELSSEWDPFRRAADYTGGGGSRLHMAYTLRLMRRGFTAPVLAEAIAHVEAQLAEGWYCWAFSNHDVARVASRWGDGSAAFAKLALALLLSLRGSACLYQGEELGLTEADLPPERLRDPYGINFWPQFKGRDGSRTPIPWRAGAPHAGFSPAEPWLPVVPAHHALAIDRQDALPDSVLGFTRRFLTWRRSHPALRLGRLTGLSAEGTILRFERVTPAERIACLFNTAAVPVALPLPPGWRALAEPGLAAFAGDEARLPGFGAAFLAAPKPSDQSTSV